MRIGVFHPTINGCGGAEWVAINIINCLRQEGHQVFLLTNERVNQPKLVKTFGTRANINCEIIFPFEPFPVTDLHNVYTDGIRTLLLKSKCEIVVDTHSNAVLPGVDITYIHHPLLSRLRFAGTQRTQLAFFYPYLFFERKTALSSKHLLIANSVYTMNAIKKVLGVNSILLFPPISDSLYLDQKNSSKREDIVVSIGRFSSEKRFHIIPSIAKLTDKRIKFIIAGIPQDAETIESILNEIKRCKVGDRVELRTNITRSELLVLLRKAKIFLHPAIGEHFGVSIAEAMALGCIPVVHNSGGPMHFLPRSNRFDKIYEAASKIEAVVDNWSMSESQLFMELATQFSESSFNKNFLNVFNSNIETKIKMS